MSFTQETWEEQNNNKENHVNGSVSLVHTLRAQVRLAVADVCRRWLAAADFKLPSTWILKIVSVVLLWKPVRRWTFLCFVFVNMKRVSRGLVPPAAGGELRGGVRVDRWSGSAAYQPSFGSVNVTWLHSAEDNSPSAAMFTESVSVRQRGKPFLVRV